MMYRFYAKCSTCERQCFYCNLSELLDALDRKMMILLHTNNRQYVNWWGFSERRYILSTLNWIYFSINFLFTRQAQQFHAVDIMVFSSSFHFHFSLSFSPLPSHQTCLLSQFQIPFCYSSYHWIVREEWKERRDIYLPRLLHTQKRMRKKIKMFTYTVYTAILYYKCNQNR